MHDNNASDGLPDDATRPMPAVPDDDATRVLPAVPRSPDEMPPAVAPPHSTANTQGTMPPDRSRGVRVAIGLVIALLAILLFSIIASLLSSRGIFAPEESPGPSATASVTPSESASPTPSASTTPTPTPSPTPTPEPTETTPAGPRFTSFVAPGAAACPDEMSVAEVTLTWTSSGAERAWVGIATDNAKEEPYSEVPPSGAATLPFPCSNASQVYTVTLEDGSGNLAHQSATVERALP